MFFNLNKKYIIFRENTLTQLLKVKVLSPQGEKISMQSIQ